MIKRLNNNFRGGTDDKLQRIKPIDEIPLIFDDDKKSKSSILKQKPKERDKKRK